MPMFNKPYIHVASDGFGAIVHLRRFGHSRIKANSWTALPRLVYAKDTH
jgi:hypothetical protein